ncbi:organic cation/carnitine transporter 2-like isoform X2 [Anguilla rostrata]|uniref:organic cation/carnitine transporter 2-like isoform X2 n=1 Tax=Anguilla rostrata TaxID=7938 RepID=UPI0030D61A9B
MRNISESAFGYWNESEGCLDGWDFSTERYESTIVTEWNLVCDEAWKPPFAASIYFFGVLIGSFVSGHFSDRFGRKPVLFASMALQIISTLLQATSTSWVMYCVFNFCIGMGTFSKYNAAFILGCEFLVNWPRTVFAAVGTSLATAVGYVLLVAFAYFIRSWRMLLVALAAFGFLFIPVWWFIPESPRWLLSQGRVGEAEAVIRAAAKRNGVPAPERIFKMEDTALLKKTDQKIRYDQVYSYLDLFKTANIRNMTILVIITWFVVVSTFFSLSLSTPNLDGDPYLNCFFSASVEIPGYVATLLFVYYCRRTTGLLTLMLFSGFTLLIIPFIPQDLRVLIIVLVMSVKTAVAAAYSFIYVYCLELYPTVVRNMGLGLATIMGCCGSMAAPYISYIGEYNQYVPFCLLGSLCVFVGAISILLPETKDTGLPEIISQVKPLSCKCGKEPVAVEMKTEV